MPLLPLTMLKHRDFKTVMLEIMWISFLYRLTIYLSKEVFLTAFLVT